MDSVNLILSLLFGTVGLGLLVYGKKEQRIVFLAAGLALMTLPYFIPNAVLLAVLCAGFTALPFVIDV